MTAMRLFNPGFDGRGFLFLDVEAAAGRAPGRSQAGRHPLGGSAKYSFDEGSS